jgi:hypothetical protein
MTRDRWLQVVAAVSLIALVVWIARHTYWDEVTLTAPPRGEAARNPYYAMMHLAQALGIPSSMIGSLQKLPPDSILFVDSLHDDLSHEPIEFLQAWVQSGGRLIIRSDTLRASEPLQLWSGIRPVPHDPNVVRPAIPGRVRAARRAADDCKLMAVAVGGVADGESLTLCDGLPAGLTSQRTPSWSLFDSTGIQVLRVPIGRGELTVVGPLFMLSNWSLPKKDHAQIFVAAAGLRHGDRLEILAPTRAEPLPVLVWRLAAPAIVFLAIAAGLMIVRHLPRFGPPVPVALPVRRSLAEQIRANARFAWRTRKLTALSASLRRALDEAAQRKIAGYSLLGPDKRAQALSASTGIDAATINAALFSDSAGSVNEHRAAITLMEACRRILISTDPNQRHPA